MLKFGLNVFNKGSDSSAICKVFAVLFNSITQYNNNNTKQYLLYRRMFEKKFQPQSDRK